MSESDITPDRVRAIDAFSDLNDDEAEQAASLARERTYRAGDELLHKGEWPEDLLALEDGEVEVRRGDDVLATLGAGSVVGERGVLDRALRNADVVAKSDVRVLFFHLNKVRTLNRDVPELAERLKQLAEQREN